MSRKTRTLNGGHVVTLHANNGLRKRCACARRAWATCKHPWAFSFKWKATPECPSGHHRFPIDKYAGRPIVTKDDARDEADRLRRLIRAGGFPPQPTPAVTTTEALTFETFAEKWRTTARATMADTLRANDAAICARLSDLLIDGRRFATQPIGLITEDIMEAVFGQLHALAGSAWNKYRDAVRLMQRWGMKKGYLLRPWLSDDNEVIVHKATAERERRLVPDVLDDAGKVKTLGEERPLLDHAGPWLQRLIIAALESGARRGELLSFTWADVSFPRGVIVVRAENAKSGKSRQIPVSPRLRAVLKMVEHDPAGEPHPPGAFVLGDAIGRQVKDPKKAWLKCCASAGITGLHFHDLRHEAGSRMLEAGWPLHHVQAVLGHADAKTTSGYLNATVQHLLDSMRRFGSGGQPLHDVAREPESEPPASGNGAARDEPQPLVN